MVLDLDLLFAVRCAVGKAGTGFPARDGWLVVTVATTAATLRSSKTSCGSAQRG